MRRQLLGIVALVAAAACGPQSTGDVSSATRDGAGSSTSSAPGAPATSGAPSTTSSNPANPASDPNAGGGVTINNVNSSTSGSSASSGTTQPDPGPAHFSLVTTSEGPQRDVDAATLEVVGVQLFWNGYDVGAVRDGMSCRQPGATTTVIGGDGQVRESPTFIANNGGQVVRYDFSHPATNTIASISTDHLGTPQMVWVVGRVRVHHVGASQDRDAHGQLTCKTDDGQLLVVFQMTPPVKLRRGHLSVAGFHLRSADISERTVSCATPTEPRPPECDAKPEPFEPSDARIGYWLAAGYASTATEQ